MRHVSLSSADRPLEARATKYIHIPGPGAATYILASPPPSSSSAPAPSTTPSTTDVLPSVADWLILIPPTDASSSPTAAAASSPSAAAFLTSAQASSTLTPDPTCSSTCSSTPAPLTLTSLIDVRSTTLPSPSIIDPWDPSLPIVTTNPSTTSSPCPSQTAPRMPSQTAAALPGGAHASGGTRYEASGLIALFVLIPVSALGAGLWVLWRRFRRT